MESTTMRRTYRYRLEPTAEQERVFVQFAGARRWAWNWALQQRREYYAATGKRLPKAELSARLTALKREPATAWLADMHAQSLQQALADLERAFANFFGKRARYPRFKSRKRDAARFRMPQDVRVLDGAIQIPKVGRIKARISRPIEGATKGATFKQDACGHWFITVVAESDVPVVALPLPTPERTVGVDLGLKDAVVTSDGERVPAPRFYRAAQRKLRRAQRSLSRKRKGSANRRKARQRVAGVHQKVANQRADFTHKLTATLIKNHQAICIEDLNTRGLARTKLAKSVLDASFGTIRQQLAYKGQWRHVHVVMVDRFYPSSKLCHECGYKHDGLTLSDRRWACPSCECIVDRDLNAARNIKREGLRILTVAAGHAETQNACGQGVRPPMAALLVAPA